MSLSVIVHLIVPGGDWMLAVPLKTDLSTRAVIRRVPELSFSVMMQPIVATTPVPVYTVPLQQKR